MNYPLISKSQNNITPNFPDYQKTYKEFSWEKGRKEIAYFDDGTVNIAHNALDKWKGSETEHKTAFIWEDDETSRSFTYGDLIAETNKFANMLSKLGIQKGDRVFMFLPRIPELYISFLGTLKVGAIAGNLFAAFGYEALEDRLADSEAKVLVTTHELEERVKKVKDQLPHLKHIILVDAEATEHGEISYSREMKAASDQFETAHMQESDPSYMLYTSGTTGKPKGVVHTHGDIVQEHITGKWILDMKANDIYWCTADPGWVTGVVYGIISPWSNGLTQLVHGGRFDPDRWYSLIEKHQVTVWYTAPTAIRMLMTNPELLKKHNLSSLRYVCSVGEPLNPEAIVWGQKYLNLPIHDNYWQTETGSIVIANYLSMDIKPGSMGKPFPGIHAGIIDDEGGELGPGKEGDLALKKGWPSMMKEIWKNPKKYESYFKGDWYITGDRAMKDEDGYFWFIGRADDVIKTSGERVGPFEVESALLKHPAVAEAGVIGKPDEVRGEIIKAFIKLKPGQEGSEALKEEIQKFIKEELAGHAYPREIEFRDTLPKTRSGKIMRRVLKMEELGQDVGDTSTMEEY
ncbi:MAG: acetate--CoA ligase [Candidatus Gracilibacteria bacterium]|nr:acetate--CoA ligase [bacterium]MDZ4216738.1 acetate--CoA ligase [Candidatus Gracilibacteria bacterium]